MRLQSISRLSDFALTRTLNQRSARERVASTLVIALIAEFDSRRLFLPAGYPSMFAYCVHELRLSEDAAYKRIRVARAARRFPAVYPGLSGGRLTLSALVLLAPHLTESSSDALLDAAAHKTNAQVEALLAARFPRPDVPACIEPVTPLGAPVAPEPELAVRPVEPLSSSGPSTSEDASQLVVQQAESIAQLAVRPVPATEPRPRVTPLAPQRFAMQLTMSQATHDKLRYAQELLGHQVPTGDLAAALDKALDALIPLLEKNKFAATSRPQSEPRPSRTSSNARHVPAAVKREVWKRDRGQCTHAAENGRRCVSRTRLEFDHVHEFARGGEASVEGIRLRCRAHNQFTAECTFGAGFMERKRVQARRDAANSRVRESCAPASGSGDRSSDTPTLRMPCT